MRPQRRKLVWATSSAQAQTLATGAQAVPADLLSNLKVAGASILGSTIMRTHLTLAFANASADTSVGSEFGLIVDSAQPDNAGDPDLTHVGNEWMLIRRVWPHVEGKAIIVGSSLLYGLEVDLRAKRRIEELEERYLFCLHNLGSGTLTFNYYARILVALP